MSGCSCADRFGGDEALVGVGGRHADVDDRGVGTCRADLAHELVGVLGLGYHLDARVLQEPHEALARDHRVLGDDYAHGISAAQGGRRELEPAAERADAVCDVDERGVAGRAVVVGSDDEAAVVHDGADVDRRGPPHRGVADRFVDGDVGACLDGRGEALVGDVVQADHERRDVGERRERRLQACLGQHRGVDAVCELAQLGERAVDLVSDVAQTLGELALCAGARQAQVEYDGEQALLRAVVQVALQAPSRLVRGRDDARPRAAQLPELGEHLRAQRLVLDRQPRGRAEQAVELAIGEHGGVVDDDREQATAAGDARRGSRRLHADRSVGVDEASDGRDPVQDLDGRVAQRHGERVPELARRRRRAEVGGELCDAGARGARAQHGPDRRRRPVRQVRRRAAGRRP